MSAGPVIIMAGGTGGHVFPALALARLLRDRQREVIWLGTRRGLEARVVPADGFPVEWLSVGGLRGKGVATLLSAPFTLARSLLQALAVMRRHRPSVVVGLGGFVTGPGGVAAFLCRRPLLIHEQNAVAGFTNRCLARIAREVLVAFPDAFPPSAKRRVIGNPVRREIASLPAPAERFAARDGSLRILVVGGSLGAARLNGQLPGAFALLQQRGLAAFDIRHQTGEKHLAATEAAYGAAGVSARVSAFIEDMAEAYGWADLIVCRSGALTVSEVAAAGLGAVLVPYPHAVDDHQTRNADYLVQGGAAVRIADADADIPRLADALATLCADGRRGLLARAQAARALAQPDATERLYERCLAAAGEGAR
jgi:UDP-N-acetylglucosamine--N-acetylmuramyl-(pentapeptide) pyrophosphoryl-undecaprenol N-acetylglucosamine transferase